MDRYSIERVVGQGSYGKALLCSRKSDGKRCIIKQISIGKLSRKERQSTEQEACILSKLCHPNIVTFWEVVSTSQHLNIVMEFADGGDLTSYITKRRGRLIPEAQVLNLFVQISLALKHVHDRKILHRDLKSDNIFLTSSGLCKLGDFGVSRVLKNTGELAATQIGTPYYMSPEIMEGRRYNSKTDIWSLGCILYELLCLKLPFDGTSMKQLAYNIIKGTPNRPPSTFSSGVIVLAFHMLEKSSKARPSINAVLATPLIKCQISGFLDGTRLQGEFSHTVLHGQNILAGPSQNVRNVAGQYDKNPQKQQKNIVNNIPKPIPVQQPISVISKPIQAKPKPQVIAIPSKQEEQRQAKNPVRDVSDKANQDENIRLLQLQRERLAALQKNRDNMLENLARPYKKENMEDIYEQIERYKNNQKQPIPISKKPGLPLSPEPQRRQADPSPVRSPSPRNKAKAMPPPFKRRDLASPKAAVPKHVVAKSPSPNRNVVKNKSPVPAAKVPPPSPTPARNPFAKIIDEPSSNIKSPPNRIVNPLPSPPSMVKPVLPPPPPSSHDPANQGPKRNFALKENWLENLEGQLFAVKHQMELLKAADFPRPPPSPPIHSKPVKTPVPSSENIQVIMVPEPPEPPAENAKRGRIVIKGVDKNWLDNLEGRMGDLKQQMKQMQIKVDDSSNPSRRLRQQALYDRIDVNRIRSNINSESNSPRDSPIVHDTRIESPAANDSNAHAMKGITDLTPAERVKWYAELENKMCDLMAQMQEIKQISPSPRYAHGNDQDHGHGVQTPSSGKVVPQQKDPSPSPAVAANQAASKGMKANAKSWANKAVGIKADVKSPVAASNASRKGPARSPMTREDPSKESESGKSSEASKPVKERNDRSNLRDFIKAQKMLKAKNGNGKVDDDSDRPVDDTDDADINDPNDNNLRNSKQATGTVITVPWVSFSESTKDSSKSNNDSSKSLNQSVSRKEQRNKEREKLRQLIDERRKNRKVNRENIQHAIQDAIADDLVILVKEPRYPIRYDHIKPSNIELLESPVATNESTAEEGGEQEDDIVQAEAVFEQSWQRQYEAQASTAASLEYSILLAQMQQIVTLPSANCVDEVTIKPLEPVPEEESDVDEDAFEEESVDIGIDDETIDEENDEDLIDDVDVEAVSSLNEDIDDVSIASERTIERVHNEQNIRTKAWMDEIQNDIDAGDNPSEWNESNDKDDRYSRTLSTLSSETISSSRDEDNSGPIHLNISAEQEIKFISSLNDVDTTRQFLIDKIGRQRLDEALSLLTSVNALIVSEDDEEQFLQEMENILGANGLPYMELMYQIVAVS